MKTKTICLYNIGVGNTELLANKIGYWQKKGLKIKMVCPQYIVSQFRKIISGVEYLEIPFCWQTTGKLVLIFELLKRNLIACFFIPKIANKTDVLYSISSVLDELLLPFFIKLFKRKIVWVALFENKVFLAGPGNWLVRLLAYLFYQISCLLLLKADKIFAISEDLKRVLVDKGIDQQKIIVTGNAVDKEKIKRAIGIRQNWCDGLFMGRLDEKKGIFDLVDICCRVVEKYPRFRLWIAGSGDKNTGENLQKKIKKAGLDKNIKLLGYISGFKKFRLLANTKIFLFPSWAESFGVALLEAVCSGTVAIAYDLPAYQAIYQNKEIITVPRGDTRLFAKKTLSILDQKDFPNRRGLKLLNSPKYDYQKLAQFEFDHFKSDA